jgi:hypothetical protein
LTTDFSKEVFMVHRGLAMMVVLLVGCSSNLPSSGWYTRIGGTEKVYVAYAGTEQEINGKYAGKFVKQDFVAAMDVSPSAKFLSEGRPRYYVVLSEGPDSDSGLRIMTVEILERDYR